MDLSFSGAGFMGCYYFGMVNCWNKYIPRHRVRRAAGASAGSLIAAYYLMDLPLDKCLKEIIEMTEDIRRRPLGVFDRSNQMVDILPKVLDKLFPSDAHKLVSGRLYVCMTRLKDMKCVIVNEFESRKDLIDALNCSCFIPVWSGNHVSTYKGTKYIDGGFTNNLPVFDEHTVRVCCFSGASDIAPYDRSQTDLMSTSVMGMPIYLTWKNFRRAGRALWPPSPSFIIDLLERGFHDTKSFILSNDLIQCDKCFKATEMDFHPILSKITPTISPAPSRSVSRSSSYMNLTDLHRAASFRRRGLNSQVKPCTELSDKNLSSGEEDPIMTATIKKLESMLGSSNKDAPSVFDERRAKSGKQIKLKSLEQVVLVKERKSFAKKLKEKLRLTSPNKANSTNELKQQLEREAMLDCKMPTIVVDQANDSDISNDDHEDENEDNNDNDENEVNSQSTRKMVTIEEIMKQESRNELDKITNDQSPASSSSSSCSITGDLDSQGDESNDSAIGDLRSKVSSGGPLAARRSSQSPAERFLASRKMSLVASQLDVQQHDQQNSLMPDRFAFAPNQLPSCPPSPNLNRHCSECIRLRQQARMDEIDESIKCEAFKYGSMESKDPEKEFNSFRYRVSSWFKQFSTPKYSYEFCDSELNENNNDNSNNNINNNNRKATTKPFQASPNRRKSEIPTLN